MYKGIMCFETSVGETNFLEGKMFISLRVKFNLAPGRTVGREIQCMPYRTAEFIFAL